MQSVGLYHSFSIWVKRDKKNLEISTCEERAFFSSISIDGKKKACRSTRQKSIDFIFFMSTSWYMKPIVLFSSSLSKHHFTFGNLFRWNNTNEFVSIQIIQYQFFWPTRKREMERYAVEIEKKSFCSLTDHLNIWGNFLISSDFKSSRRLGITREPRIWSQTFFKRWAGTA